MATTADRAGIHKAGSPVQVRQPAILKYTEDLITASIAEQEHLARLKRKTARANTVTVCICVLVCAVTFLIVVNMPGCGWGETRQLVSVLQPGGTTRVIEVCTT